MRRTVKHPVTSSNDPCRGPSNASPRMPRELPSRRRTGTTGASRRRKVTRKHPFGRSPRKPKCVNHFRRHHRALHRTLCPGEATHPARSQRRPNRGPRPRRDRRFDRFCRRRPNKFRRPNQYPAHHLRRAVTWSGPARRESPHSYCQGHRLGPRRRPTRSHLTSCRPIASRPWPDGYATRTRTPRDPRHRS
jgi:hypothetical protein